MIKKYVSYFILLTFILVPAILKAENEPQEGLNLKEELKSEANQQKMSSDYLPYLDHFGASQGVGILVGVADRTTTTEDSSYNRLGTKIAFALSSTENITDTVIAKSNLFAFELDETGIVAFILAGGDIVARSKFSSISHFKLGGRIFRVLPSMRSYNDKDEELLKIERFNWVEADLPMPVFKVGQDQSPVRVLFGPNLHGELSVRNMVPDRSLKAQYPNLPVDHIHNNQSASVSAGWNVLVLLGKPGRKAWQVGGSVNAMRERSTEETLNMYNVTQKGFKLFLASPTVQTKEGAQLQLVLGYAKSSSDVDTFVTLNDGTNDESNWARMPLPEFDLDEEAVYFDMIIRF